MINTNQVTSIALIALLAIGCVYVLQPFMAAVLFAAIFCVFTWPVYHRLWLRLGKRDTWAAITMTLLLLVALILPMAYLAIKLADSADLLFNELSLSLQSLQPHAPSWVQNFPVIGDQMSHAWQRTTASHEEMMTMLKQYYEPMRALGLRAVQLVAGGLLQLLVAVFVAFFFYRDGVRLAQGLVSIVRRLGAHLGKKCSICRAAPLKA